MSSGVVVAVYLRRFLDCDILVYLLLRWTGIQFCVSNYIEHIDHYSSAERFQLKAFNWAKNEIELKQKNYQIHLNHVQYSRILYRTVLYSTVQ